MLLIPTRAYAPMMSARGIGCSGEREINALKNVRDPAET